MKNSSLTWDASWPQLTDCFQSTVLIYVPCGFLWLATPIYAVYLAGLPSVTSRHFSTLLLAKLTLLSITLSLTVIDTVNIMSEQPDSMFLKAAVLAPLSITLTMILALTLTIVERRKRLVTSGVQFVFWLLLSISRLVSLYTAGELKEYSEDTFSFSLSSIEVGLFLALFLIQFFPEKRVQSFTFHQRPCGELAASFPSRVFFSWINWLLRMGYSTTMTQMSLSELRPQDKSQAIVARFLPRWTSALQRARAAQARTYHRNESNGTREWEANYTFASAKTKSPDEKTPLLSPSKSETINSTIPASSSANTAWSHNLALKSHKADHKSGVKDIKLTSPSLTWSLLRTFWLDVLLSQIFKLPYDFLIICNPLLLGQLVEFVEEQNPALWKGYILAVALFISMMMQSVLLNQVFHFSMALGLRLRTALVSAIFRKSLTMDNRARGESTVGQVVNLMSVDAEHVENVTSYAWAIWSSSLQIALSLYLLYTTVGVSMFAGAAFLFLLIPANGVATSILGHYQAEIMAFKDQRMKLLNEMLAGMKIVKFFAWEKSFEQRILEVRDSELRKLLHTGYVMALPTFSWTAAPFLSALMTYLCYVYVSDDHYLDPKTAFVAISLFDVLRFAMNFLPSVITDLIQAIVSMRRIANFLRHNDLDETNVGHDPHAGHAISIRTGTFRWHSETEATLNNVNLNIEDDSLVAVVGPVGCGKSSLLSALLGEMEKVDGKVNVRGTVAYVPQQAWIQNDTLRNNILFGRPMDFALYMKCLEGCALQPDLDILPAGDQTEIGEKGINLSGGQKQRVSLARALYSQADIYLLDDPLSAVDSHVGRHIFDKVIGHNGLLEGKVRLLVTHGIQYLPSTDHIVVLGDGSVTESGHYEKLLAHNGPFARLITSFLKQEDSNKNAEDDTFQTLKQEMLRMLSETEEDDDGGHVSDGSSSKLFRRLSRSVSQMSETGQESKLTHDDLVKQRNQLATIIEEEKVEIGRVNLRVFSRYLRSIGIIYGLIIIGCFLAYGALDTAGNIFLSTWTDDPDLANFTLWAANSSERRHANDYYIGIYGLFGGLQTVAILVFAVFESNRLVAASRDLHSSMLRSVLRAPMSFFDTTPVGRLINRFSKDMEEVDQQLALTFVMWIDSLSQMIFTFIIISYSTPIFLAFIVPVAIIYFFVQRYFITTSRQLKRLGSKTRSPIFNHFSESLAGASVIRAFGAQHRFVVESEAKVDLNQAFIFYNNCVNRWLGIRLETVGNVVILLAAGIAVATSDQISGGIMGLSITYALGITENLNWLVRMTSDLETQIVSVERIVEYTEIESEAEWDNDLVKSPPGWPQQGRIKFDNLSLRYRDGLDLVLKNINFEVKPEEKVGIVGRTGAGKSSLTLALFRLVEAAGGKILIDGTDIGVLGLHDLRSKLTILPQDPVMFAGTLRDNLDPFSEFDDEAVWTALEHAHLKRFVEGLTLGLGHMCGEGGENLSVGQRQLVCLARALLHKTKILILDEATAAVDMETDELIQETIRTEFKDCTILTIAHRLNTVMDYDRILVLEKGEVKEFDTPSALLEEPNGLFREMAKSAGIV
ncbi:multidrug resistance-associated protein 1 [Plakobranchus ocellatus]|uniref:ABC-type glutathione-S-conjugate transporter n=1 Tax=Plakobranchus ocellatus TaxID=259542 RepID=A0AAV4DDT0_9GAST|nr:multidrug resistance-associated protein 1 [Plakobranchus ocellatus]